MHAHLALVTRSSDSPHADAAHLHGAFHVHRFTLTDVFDFALPSIRSADVVLAEWDVDHVEVVRDLRRVLPRRVPLVAFSDTAAECVAACVLGADYVEVSPVTPALLQAYLIAYRRRTGTQQLPDPADLADYVPTSDGGEQAEPLPPPEPVPVAGDEHAGDAAHGDVAAPAAVPPAGEGGELLRLRLDEQAHQFYARGEVLDLQPMSYDLLAFFVQHPNTCLTRDELLSAVWGIDFDPNTNVVDVHVSRLRKALQPHGLRVRIQTVVGQGYRYDPERAAE